jgi:hypothetical protein
MSREYSLVVVSVKNDPPSSLEISESIRMIHRITLSPMRKKMDTPFVWRRTLPASSVRVILSSSDQSGFHCLDSFEYFFLGISSLRISSRPSVLSMLRARSSRCRNEVHLMILVSSDTHEMRSSCSLVLSSDSSPACTMRRRDSSSSPMISPMRSKINSSP